MPQLQITPKRPSLSLSGFQDTLSKALYGDQPSFLERFSALPTRDSRESPSQFINDPVFRELATGFSPAGMAKVFKPGPDTLEKLIGNLAKAGQKLAPRERLLPAVRNPHTGEVFTGSMGGTHPFQQAVDTLTRRKQPVSGRLEFGYQIPGEKPFIPETLANFTQKEGFQTVNKLLNETGVSLEIILDLLKKGAPLGGK